MTLEDVLRYPLARRRGAHIDCNTGNDGVIYTLRYKEAFDTVEIPWGMDASEVMIGAYQIFIPYSPHPYSPVLPKTPLSLLNNTIANRNNSLVSFTNPYNSEKKLKSVFGLLLDNNNIPILEFTEVRKASNLNITLNYICRISKTFLTSSEDKLQEYIRGSLFKNLLGIVFNSKHFDIVVADFKSPLYAVPNLPDNEEEAQTIVNNLMTANSERIVNNML